MSQLKDYPIGEICGNGANGTDGAFDTSTESLKISDINQSRFADVIQQLADATNLSATTHYFPSSGGVCTLGYQQLISLALDATAGATDQYTITLEGSNDETNWFAVTQTFLTNENTAIASKVITDDTVLFGLTRIDPDYAYYRLKVVVTGGTSNSLEVTMLQKAK